MSDVQINVGSVTLLLPHPKSVAAAPPATNNPGMQSYGRAIKDAMETVSDRSRSTVSRVSRVAGCKAVLPGWHARFKLERHGLQVGK